MAAASSFHPTPHRATTELSRVVPAWLAPRLDHADVRVIDVRGAKSFVRGHVPGSVLLDVRGQLFSPGGAMVSAAELALAMSSLGVGDEHAIVLVDHAPESAALDAAWALRHYGVTNVHLLDGGFARWGVERRPISREIVRHPPASFTARAV